MMETKTQLTIGIIITLLLASSGTYYISQDDNAYHCESRNIVMICEKLSSGIGTRCYFEDTYKTCKEGWKEIQLNQEIKIENSVSSVGNKWECSPEGCIKIN